ncbi:hypothetical protein [Enterococcus sp. DIV0806c]|uniref:hypothetical protein n=1 Tax=unclassified Enterococcus TaxID=2608891 RepID=UPI003F1F352C
MFRKKGPDMLVKNYSHEEIQVHTTLSEKVVSIDLFGPLSDKVHYVELKKSKDGAQYLVLIGAVKITSKLMEEST